MILEEVGLISSTRGRVAMTVWKASKVSPSLNRLASWRFFNFAGAEMSSATR